MTACTAVQRPDATQVGTQPFMNAYTADQWPNEGEKTFQRKNVHRKVYTVVLVAIVIQLLHGVDFDAYDEQLETYSRLDECNIQWSDESDLRGLLRQLAKRCHPDKKKPEHNALRCRQIKKQL